MAVQSPGRGPEVIELEITVTKYAVVEVCLEDLWHQTLEEFVDDNACYELESIVES